MAEEDARERNRREFPETARVVDLFREAFGPGVGLVWAVENGKAVGPVPEGVRRELGCAP